MIFFKFIIIMMMMMIRYLCNKDEGGSSWFLSSQRGFPFVETT